MKRVLILIPLLMILSACGVRAVPQATSTASTLDLPGTIAAAGATNIAQTQAALPTITPSPTATLTNTPAPTATFLPLPTLDAALTPLADGSAATEDPCINKVLPETLAGEKIRIRVDNPTRATLNVSIYLQQTGPQSECGYRGYSLAPGQSLVVNDLVVGCYTLWAWNPDPQNYFIVTNGTSCLNASQPWTFDISTSSIKLRE